MEEDLIGLYERLIVALSANERLHKKIDEIYNENKETYYALYKNSPFYNATLFDLYRTSQKLRMHKVAGIVVDVTESGQPKQLLSLVKLAHNKLYRYIQRTDSPSYNRIVKLALNGREMENVDSTELLHFLSLTGFLLYHFDKDLLNGSDLIIDFVNTGVEVQSNSAFALKEVEFIDERYETNEEDDECMQDFHVKDCNYNLIAILDRIIETEIKDEIATRNIDLDQTELKEIRHEVFRRGGESSLIGLVTSMYKIMGISEDILSASFHPYHYKRLFHHFNVVYKANNLPKEHYRSLLICMLFSMGLALEYFDTRKNYLAQNEEETFIQMESIREKTAVEMQEHKQELLGLKQELAQNQQQLTSLRMENDRLKLENKRLEKEMVKKSENDKELQALRTLAFSLEQDINEEEISGDVQTPVLDEWHVVVAGGHENWINKLKEQRPNFTFIKPENKTINLSFLNKDKTVVFFNTFYNNHTIYERVMNEMKYNDNPLFYINSKGTNVNLILSEMERMIRTVE